MKTFVQIINGRVHWKFQDETNPYAAVVGMDVRDVTNTNPQPQEGWLVSEGGVYSAPPAEQAPDPTLIGKTTGVTYNEFRSLLTISELALIENFDQDDYFAALGKTPLTVLQKGTLRFLIAEAKATGAPGERGINLASPKMTQGLADLAGMGIITAPRVAEIQQGKKKS